MDQLPFYIATSDATSFILSATCYLYNKYWGSQQHFKILGNHSPLAKLPDNFEFIKIKDQNDIKQWTKYIYEFILQNEKSEYFVLALDDYFPNKHLSITIYDNLLSFARQNNNVGRIALGWSPVRELQSVKKFDQFELFKLEQDALYRLACQPSLWKREYLLKYFNHNWTPWDLELKGSELAKSDGAEIIVAKNGLAFDWIEESALSGRWPGKVNILGLQKEDTKHLIEQGIFKKENLQYGIWPKYKYRFWPSFKPLSFSEIGFNFKFSMLKGHLDKHTFETLLTHYGHIYQ